MIWLYLFLGAGIAAAAFARPLGLGKIALTILGGAVILAGVATLAVVEWRYLPAANKPLDVALPLARAGTFAPPAFAPDRSGAYDLWLQTDRSPGLEAFGCLTADPGFEALCPKREPQLDLAWTVTANGTEVAHGATDLAGFRARRAAIAPAEAARKLHDFRDYVAKTDNPADQSPLYHRIGTFDATAGRTLRLALAIRAPAPALAAAHPRLIVGLSRDTTGGSGLTAAFYCVLCLFAGGYMLLRAQVPRKATAP